MKYILAAVLSLALMPIMAMAGDFEKGWAAYQDGDYTTAFCNWVRPAFDVGHPKFEGAAFMLGHMYDEGIGVPKDEVLAHMLFSMVTAQSDDTLAPFAEVARDGLEKRMSPADISKSLRLAGICVAVAYDGGCIQSHPPSDVCD
jgi:hypothetical protein